MPNWHSGNSLGSICTAEHGINSVVYGLNRTEFSNKQGLRFLSGANNTTTDFVRSYGWAISLALLLHFLLLFALWQTKFTPPVKPVTATAITSFLYQPVPAAPVQTLNESSPEVQNQQSLQQVKASIVIAEEVSRQGQAAVEEPVIQQNTAAATPVENTAGEEATRSQQTGLAQRAFSRAAAADPSAVERSALASYQQFLQAQQQPKATVDKRHQQLSSDPAGQVLAQLDDSRQLIRTKDGCRIADPTKDGFEGLMATRAVPCGDKASSTELLRQALEKHSKR